MPTPNQGQTRLVKGTWSSECTTETDLIRNQAIMPYIKPMMYRVDRRQLTTLLTSGAVGPYGMNLTVPEKFGKPEAGKMIGNSSMQFNVMPRLVQTSTILQQVGASSTTDGSFQLLMADAYVYKGQNVQFGNSGQYQALCMSEPTKVAGGYLYNFQHKQGITFVYATHAAPNSNGTATLMPVDTNYGEGSNKGYSRDMAPDRFIVDMTIQRMSISITGDAANDVLWYEYTGTNGITKGWKYEKVHQGEAIFAWQNEFAKKFGISSMKDSTGARLSQPIVVDTDENIGIISGDGIREQISGGNVLYGSGVDGNATYEDFVDAMGLATKKSNSMTNGVNLVFLTGLDGFYNFQYQSARIVAALGGTIFQSEKGGAVDVKAGYIYNTITFGGSTLTVIVDPMFDDQKLFPATGSDGKSIMSGTYIGGNLEDGTGANMEIIAKGAHGGNRSDVRADLQGMTGMPGEIITQKDAYTYAMLKQDLICIYNTHNWLEIRKN
jgi:hypothetical protein